MDYVRLGNSNLRVSKVILGTAFQRKNTAKQVLQAAIERGINTFDTSSDYGSEEALGKHLSAYQRDNYVLMTKFSSPIHGSKKKSQIVNSNSSGISRELIYASLHNSLKFLRTDYIDIFQLHHPHPLENYEEMIITLENLVAQGKIRYCGLSNFTQHGLFEMKKNVLSSSRRNIINNGNNLFISNQMYTSALSGLDKNQIKLFKRIGLGTIAYGVLAEGLLTMKYHPAFFTGGGDSSLSFKGRLDKKSSYFVDDFYQPDFVKRLASFCDLANEIGISPAQLAIAYVNNHSGIDAFLLGATSREQLDFNIHYLDEVSDFELNSKIDSIFGRDYSGGMLFTKFNRAISRICRRDL
jgi:aryl-alcohol dehydrogenase-like predicted oxidoreductase